MEASSIARERGRALPRSRRVLAAAGDERLVDQLRRGNEVAFEVLYDRHHRGILSFCRHMLGSREEAEDALQHTFMSAYDDLRGSEKAIRLKPWLYTIARNRCLTMLRARRETASDLVEPTTAGLADEVQQRADLRELLADLGELPADQRAALVLSELGDLAHADVAHILDCEAGKVKSLVYQARSALMESRRAREMPCQEIREQLSTLRGGALRRAPLRRHLKSCPGCAAFRDDVRRQRQMMAVVLPVIPSLGLKDTVLAAVGFGAGGGGIAGGGGLAVAMLGKAGAAKVATVAVIAGGATAGGVAVSDRDDTPPPPAAAAPLVTPAGGSAPGSPPGSALAPGVATDDLTAAEPEKRGAEREKAKKDRDRGEKDDERGDRGKARSDEARDKARERRAERRERRRGERRQRAERRERGQPRNERAARGKHRAEARPRGPRADDPKPPADREDGKGSEPATGVAPSEEDVDGQDGRRRSGGPEQRIPRTLPRPAPDRSPR